MPVFWLSAAGLSGCSWVDSTGVQEDAPVVTLDQGNVLELVENEALFLDPGDNVDPDGSVRAWRWGNSPIEAGDLNSCEGIADFNREFVASSMLDACVTGDECELYFKEETIDEGDGDKTVFLLRPPILKAPVGVTYQLFATEADGRQTTSDFTFCLIPVNDPPIASDDSFSVVEGTELRTSTNGPNLLSNDRDDIDASNTPLKVDTTNFVAPGLAESFSLFGDGNFVYVPRAGQTGTDSFVYTITDGIQTSSATALITIVAADSPPVFQGPVQLPPIVVGVPVQVSLADYFSDPEGSQLVFTASGLPLGLELTPTGDLLGSVVPGSAGSSDVVINVSDGNSDLTVTVPVAVDPNLPPVSEPIPDQSVGENASIAIPLSRYFSDPEQRDLTYGLEAPAGLLISIDRRTGVVSGLATTPGEYVLRVTVSDGVNVAIAEDFTLVVTEAPNRRPTYDGAIANQSIELGEAIAAISPSFSDPDGDDLVFELVGETPDGIVINSRTGVVSGTPSSPGIYRNIVIMATDPGGLSISSDTFNLVITEPLEINQPPQYSGSIADLTVVAGEPIDPIGGDFSDPDGDDLTYTVTGRLPAGLAINVDGFIVGVPTAVGRTGLLRIVATDPSGEEVQSDRFRITVEAPVVIPENNAPLFPDLPAITVEEGETIRLVATASDVDGDSLTYSLSGSAADSLSISRNGIITGSFDEAGTYQGIITVDDGLSTTSIGFEVEVEAAPAPTATLPPPLPNSDPTVTDIPNRSVTGSFSVDVATVFTDPDGDVMTYTAVGLPPGITISEDGIISGASTSANRGPHFIVVTADDGRGGVVSDGFRLTII